ncbi:MAG: VTT domain-containing protein [Methylococcales bacterium]|nr:VTT domain-containing protein [Methylococcales bacterium]
MIKKYYDLALNAARHRHALRYLCLLSFAESAFFPVPPDVMLAPMAMATPEKAYRYAAWTTISSVLGGVLGYGLGFFLYEFVEPWLQQSHYWPAMLKARAWFTDYGVWAVLAAGFSPIPYKIFTISAGALHMAMAPFVLASLLGRGGRFFLVAFLLRMGGQGMETRLRASIDKIGWLVVIGIVLAGCYQWWSSH